MSCNITITLLRQEFEDVLELVEQEYWKNPSIWLYDIITEMRLKMGMMPMARSLGEWEGRHG